MANYVQQTWTDGVSQTSAARMANMEQGIYDAHFQPAARVFHTVNQSATHNTNLTLAFNTENIDQDGLGTSTIHDNATNNSRLICRVAGNYVAVGQCEWAANATGERRLNIVHSVNGTLTRAVMAGHASIQLSQIVVMPPFPLAVNEYLELVAFQNSGGALNVVASGTIMSPNFGMWRVG